MNLWEIHPALVHFPIAFLLGAVFLDLFAWGRSRRDLAGIATGLLVAGVVAAALTAAAGLVAYYTVPAHTEQAHDLMTWHLWLNVTVLVLFTAVTISRWKQSAPPAAWARVTGLVAAVVLMISSYLGGVIVYYGGAGIDPKILAPEIRTGHHHGGSGMSDMKGMEGEHSAKSHHDE